MWGLRVNEALGLTQAMQWKVEWRVMSLTKGECWGLQEEQERWWLQDLLFKSNFQLQSDPDFLCGVDFIFDSCCLVVPSARRRVRFGHLIHLCCLTSRCLWNAASRCGHGGGYTMEDPPMSFPLPWSALAVVRLVWEMKYSYLILGLDCFQMIVCLLKIIGKPALEFWAKINHSSIAVDFMWNYSQKRKREKSRWEDFLGRSLLRAIPW